MFAATDADVRDYLHDRGGDFKVKDLRTWHGTNKALETIAKMPVPKSEAAFKKAQREVSVAVAKHLGNTPAVAKSSYIDPAVWSKWKAAAPGTTSLAFRLDWDESLHSRDEHGKFAGGGGGVTATGVSALPS